MITWTKKQARDYMVNYHMINNGSKPTIKEVFKRIKTIQYDPLNVVGTNSELVLQSRVPSFKKKDLYNALYKERYLIDGWDKQMCIYESKYFSHFYRVREQRSLGELNGAKKYLNLDCEHIIDDVFDIIKEQGPIMSSQIDLGERRKNRWGGIKASNIAIGYLFHKGLIGVESRRNTQKKYLDINHLFDYLDKDDYFLNKDDFAKWYLYRRIKSLGLAWNKSGVAFSGIHIQNKATRSKYLKELIDMNIITEVHIEGVKETFYVPTKALDYQISIKDKIAIIAPLDNLIWDRALINTVFDFEYTWEVYTPKSKRKYGYYVLPLLKGSEFIGRIEFEHQRNGEPLSIINTWFEKGIRTSKKLDSLLEKSLKNFSKYLEIK